MDGCYAGTRPDRLVFTLYYAAHTCSLASHIALEDAGAKYNLKRISFSKIEQQSPAYLEVNPKARVPAMMTPRGILTETPAMLAFIAQLSGGAVGADGRPVCVCRNSIFQ